MIGSKSVPRLQPSEGRDGMAGINRPTDGWETKEEPDVVLRVRQAQVQQLYKQTWTGLVGVLAITLAAFVVLWPVVPPWKLSLWGGALVLLTIARGVLGLAFHRRAPSGPSVLRWARLHVASATASGLIWAVPSFILWPADSPVHQLLWPICIVSLSASAVATYSTWTPSYLSFLVLSAVPLAVRLLLAGGPVYVALGLLALFYIAVLVQTGRVMHAASLSALVIGVRNEALSSVLSEGKAQLEEVNAQLHQEIDDRAQAHERLRLQNQQLERLNTQLSIAKESLEEANRELEEAAANIKQLGGMLPICASCKKIRNDKGYWEQIEGYIRQHSEVEFSHGICPDCEAGLYRENPHLVDR
jgi:hypothetical protein